MTDLRILVAAAAVLIAACQPAQSAPAKAAPAPAAVVAASAAATAAAQPSAEQAQVWVMRLYERYADDSFSPFKDPAATFDTDLVAALAEDSRLTPEGEMGAIDADPICSCQDPTDMKAKVVKAAMTGPTTARIEVELKWPLPENPIPDQIADYTRTNVLIVALGPNGWRVRDIGEGDASFLKSLNEANAEQRARVGNR